MFVLIRALSLLACCSFKKPGNAQGVQPRGSFPSANHHLESNNAPSAPLHNVHSGATPHPSTRGTIINFLERLKLFIKLHRSLNSSLEKITYFGDGSVELHLEKLTISLLCLIHFCSIQTKLICLSHMRIKENFSGF